MSKNVVWQSADGLVTSDHCRVTVQRIFSNFFQIAWNVEKTLFDSRPTVAWPPTTVTWPFSDFFQKFSICLKRRKNVVWQSADGRVTSDHCRVTVQWLFSQKFLIAWNIQKRCFTVGRRSRDLNHCRVTVQRLFSKILPFAWYLGKQLFDSRPTVASPPTWLEHRKNVVCKSADCHVTVRLVCSRVFFSYGFTYCLADVYLVFFLILSLSFRQKLGHVSPLTGMARSWKFHHHMKARDRAKRISDFGGNIPTRWFPMRETSSPL